MDRRLQQSLAGDTGHYLLPFFWQRHEDEQTLRQYMRIIHSCGIQEVCLESRTHPDFMGETWWQDMDILMEEARRLNMRIWVLDDRSFPTGSANGKAADLPDALHKRCLVHVRDVDVVGPQQGGYVLTRTRGRSPLDPPWTTAHITTAVAVRLETDPCGNVQEDPDSLTDLTPYLQDERLCWDVPEGRWRVVLIEETVPHRYWADAHLNHLIPASTDLLIREVYEPHYARYAADFGTTFAGFFSDEPGFYCEGGEMLPLGAGNPRMHLPWCPEMWDELSQALGEDCHRLLPALWMDLGEVGARVRYTYMDLLTRRYRDYFSGRLGNWCREHGVEYIGHIIEDNNAHSRIKVSAGHYFRALWGQDMAGVDVVLSQLLPGLDTTMETFEKQDGEFYHYTLAKLAVSLARLDPKKKNRALCEIFGAYGWGEGLRLMKWLADHMLVRGITHFVPHAFCPAPFPEPDCPPHFFAHGNNPQFPYFSSLMQYMNRMAHLLYDEEPGSGSLCPAAILYTAEAEWGGACQQLQKPSRMLTAAQIDFAYLPVDCMDQAQVRNGILQIGGARYRVMLIPYAERLPLACLKQLAAWASHIPVAFVDGFPTAAVDGDGTAALHRLEESAVCIPLEELVVWCRSKGCADLLAPTPMPWLRVCHLSRGTTDLYMLFNESPYDTLCGEVCVPVVGPVVRYDGMANRLYEQPSRSEQDRTYLPLRLTPYESTVWIFGEDDLQPEPAVPAELLREELIPGPYALAVSAYDAAGVFTDAETLEELVNLAVLPTYTTFSGTMRYTTVFSAEIPAPSQRVFLNLGEVYETAAVRINGPDAGFCIAPPYRLDVTALLRPGNNTLEIDVINTLVKAFPDFYSRGLLQDPSGLLGPVTLEYRA